MTTYYRNTQVDDGNMDREVAQAVAANKMQAMRIQHEARQRMAPSYLTELSQAETQYRDAQTAFTRAQQQPPLVGDVRERALQRLEWEEQQNDARTALARAEQTVTRARKAFAAAERGTLDGMLREAEAWVSRCHDELQAKVGGAPTTDWANGMLVMDPAIGQLVAVERTANVRLAAIAKAITELYQ